MFRADKIVKVKVLFPDGTVKELTIETAPAPEAWLEFRDFDGTLRRFEASDLFEALTASRRSSRNAAAGFSAPVRAGMCGPRGWPEAWRGGAKPMSRDWAHLRSWRTLSTSSARRRPNSRALSRSNAPSTRNGGSNS